MPSFLRTQVGDGDSVARFVLGATIEKVEPFG